MYVDSREKVTARYQASLTFTILFTGRVVRGTCRIVLLSYFRLHVIVDLPIEKRVHGDWELQTDWNSFTKSTQGMGLAYRFVV